MAAFTTVAAGIGLATTAGTTAMSFANAGKQRNLMKKAEESAATAMAEARQKLEVNVYDKLAIQKEPYELQREAMLSQGAQAIQAGVESERGAAATAGRVQMAANEGQAAIRTAMGQDLQQLEMLSAQEDSRLRDIGVQLDLEEVAGAQLAAANAQELGAQATAQGMQGLTSMASQLAEQAPLFEKSASARQIKGMERVGKGQGFDAAGVQNRIASIGMVGDVDFSKVSGMDRADFLEFMEGQDAQTLINIKNKLGLGKGQKVPTSDLRQGRLAMLESAKAMNPTIDRLKQGKPNSFLKDPIDYNFPNPFIRQ
jgi:hypothetical protein